MALLTPVINNRNNPQFNNPGRGMRFAWNVLITGANGFIGKALCERLLSDGYQVRGAVRSESQMAVLPSGVEGVMVGDIGPETDWSEALNGIDVVVHLAARVHVMREGAADPLAAFREVNVEGTKRLAIAAANAGVKRFVYISSVKVNGEGTEGRGQKSEVRGQEKTEVGKRQKAEVRGQRSEGREKDERPTSNIECPTSNEKQKKQKPEARGQEKTEVGRRKSEVRGQRSEGGNVS